MPLQPQLEQFQRRLAEVDIAAQEIRESEVAVRAAHSAVGDIVIRVEDSGLIVSVGNHFHQHFATCGDSGDELEGAIQFVIDFLRDRIVLTITFTDSRPIHARIDNVETGAYSWVVFPAMKRTLWSRLLSLFRRPREVTQSFRCSGPVEAASPSPNDDEPSLLADRLSQLSPDQMKELANYLARKADESQREN